MAVVPPDNPLVEKDELTLADLATQPFILLDEGRESVTLHAFEQAGLSPHVCYEVTDDYSILAGASLAPCPLHRQRAARHP